MKLLIPVMLGPVVLTGCAINAHLPPSVPAQEFVTTLMQEQIPLIQQAQNELAQVSKVRLSLPPSKPTPVVLKSGLETAAAKKPELSALAGKTVPAFKQIRYIGDRPATIALARAGTAQTLNQAIKLIAPAGWQIVYSSDLKPDARRTLNWTGNDQWPFVLDDLLSQQGLVALIDWPKQQVSIAQKSAGFTPGSIAKKSSIATIQPVSQLKTPVAPVTSPPLAGKSLPGRNPFAEKTSLATNAPAQPALKATIIAPKAVIKPKVWRIETGSTLKDTLFNWAADEKCTIPGVSHWTVAWLTQVNYRIDAPLQFEGNFREVLNSLFTLYGTTQVPLYAGVRNAQCVISVDDKEIH
ncbi:toxin co-regulated pilus biosynthesis Q family protein [Rahnella aceris]